MGPKGLPVANAASSQGVKSTLSLTGSPWLATLKVLESWVGPFTESHQLSSASTAAAPLAWTAKVVLPLKSLWSRATTSVAWSLRRPTPLVVKVLFWMVKLLASTFAPSPTRTPTAQSSRVLFVTVTVVMSPLEPGLYWAKRMPLVQSVRVLPSMSSAEVPGPLEIRMPLATSVTVLPVICDWARVSAVTPLNWMA